MDPVSLYINWVLHAVYGKMAEADQLYRIAGDAIASVADELELRFPIAPGRIYRGVLIEDVATFKPHDRLTFLSWSEDRDVARWFGSTESFISEPLTAHQPNAKGYVLTWLQPDPTIRVLFHHSWRNAFGMPLERLALMHPMMGGEGHRQIKWSLDTQREVITEPMTMFPKPEPVESIEGPSITELDKRFTPPWARPRCAYIMDNYTDEKCGRELPCEEHR